MAKKIILVNGSPRKNGLTSTLLQKFMVKIESLIQEQGKGVIIEMIHLSDYMISHCTGCDACLKKPNTCPLSEKDDMLIVEEKLMESKAIIVGSPSYFGNVTGLVKVLIDRSRPMKMAKYKLQNKYFSVITTSGLKDGGSNWVADALNHWAIIQGMIVVGGLGHPVLMNNIPSESLQGQKLTEFRKPTEPSELAVTLAENLAERILDLI